MFSAVLVFGSAVLSNPAAAQAPAVATGVQQAPAPQPAAPTPGPVQTAPAPQAQPQTAGVAQRILVQGNERIEESTILSYLTIAPGQTVTAAILDAAEKTLFNTGLFADVGIGLQGTDLVVRVTENPIINQVVFEGNHNLKEDKLRDEVQVRPRGIFTRAKVQADVQRIVELYRRSGRVNANVTPKIVELPQKRVDLVFEIDEGAKSGILNINVLGNKEFSDNALHDVIVTKESKWYRFFTNNDNYDPDRIEYDRDQLRKFYRNRGYYDFHVLSAVAELVPEKNGFNVTYVLEEGGKYKFGKVTVETDLKRLNPAQLQRLLPIREGQQYQEDLIERSTDAMTFAAGAAGFAFVDVRPRYTANAKTHTVDVNFQITEGPRVYIERIDVVGNTRTIDPVIRRQLLVAEGDAYNRVLVDRSKTMVRALGFFKDVDITQTPGSAPDKTVLRVAVTEQPTGELSFSLGYSSVDQLIADVGITERTFRGRGQQVTFRVSAGYLQKSVDFGFTQPHLFGRNLDGGFELYATDLDYSRYTSYRTTSVGGNVNLGFPLTETSRIAGNYTLRSDRVAVDSSLCVPGQYSVSRTLCDQRGSYITSSVGYIYRVDLRDDPVVPTRGFLFVATQQLAGVGGTVRYIKSTIDAQWYHRLWSPAWVVMLEAQGGDIEPWGADYIRVNDRFYSPAGNQPFRGFQVAGIGPRDILYGDALGGKIFGKATFELNFPNFLPEQYGIQTALFAEAETLGSLDARAKVDPLTGLADPNIRDELALRAVAGVTVYWKSPMGPLRFDLSQIIKKQPYDRTETFQFRTSTRFQ
ncbi:MAG: outer membrane protein assembly factor BamA [Caulobacteraceae bacterium]